MQAHKTVSREQWLEARRALLAKEKAHLRAHDELARQRRGPPEVAGAEQMLHPEQDRHR